MTASVIPFQLILVPHIWISLPLPLIIVPAQKKSRYTSDPLPDSIYVASRKSTSMLTTPSVHPQLFEPNYIDHYSWHTIISDNSFHGRTKRGHCPIFRGGKRCYKNWVSIDTHVKLPRGYITVVDLSEWVNIYGLDLLNTTIVYPFVKLIGVLTPFSPLLHLLNLFLWFLFLVSWPHTVSILLSVIIETFSLYFCCCLF